MTARTDAELLEDAAAWFVRLREKRDGETRAALRRWMALDLRHAAAIDLVERGWHHAAALAPTASFPMPASRWSESTRRSVSHGRRVSPRQFGWATGLAAAIALMIGAEQQGVGLGLPHRYITAGSARDIMLADGSHLRLQPNSTARVRMSLFSRDVTLGTGIAAFAVAHETRRPFSVHAGPIAVEATGTYFAVGTGSTGTRVALWKGGVRLRDSASGAVLTHLKPGDRADIGSAGRLTVTRARQASPAQPRVFVFDETPLAEAVTRIAARTGVQVRFGSPDLARLTVNSVYHGNDLTVFLDNLRAIEPICWRRSGPIIEIESKTAGCRRRPMS
jgi:transmembrane sensor